MKLGLLVVALLVGQIASAFDFRKTNSDSLHVVGKYECGSTTLEFKSTKLLVEIESSRNNPDAKIVGMATLLIQEGGMTYNLPDGGQFLYNSIDKSVRYVPPYKYGESSLPIYCKRK